MTYSNWPNGGNSPDQGLNGLQGQQGQWQSAPQQQGQAPSDAAQHFVQRAPAQQRHPAQQFPHEPQQWASPSGTDPHSSMPKQGGSTRTIWWVLGAAVVAIALADAQAWVAETYGTYEPVSQSGSGSTEFLLPEGISSGYVVATYNSTGEFRVLIEESANEDLISMPIAVEGPFEGAISWRSPSLPKLSAPKVKITAEGDWALQFLPFDKAPECTGAGYGSGVFLYTGSGGTLDVTHEGASFFTVKTYSDDDTGGDYAIDERGRWEGKMIMPEGPVLVDITATGDWTFTP